MEYFFTALLVLLLSLLAKRSVGNLFTITVTTLLLRARGSAGTTLQCYYFYYYLSEASLRQTLYNVIISAAISTLLFLRGDP